MKFKILAAAAALLLAAGCSSDEGVETATVADTGTVVQEDVVISDVGAFAPGSLEDFEEYLRVKEYEETRGLFLL